MPLENFRGCLGFGYAYAQQLNDGFRASLHRYVAIRLKVALDTAIFDSKDPIRSFETWRFRDTLESSALPGGDLAHGFTRVGAWVDADISPPKTERRPCSYTTTFCVPSGALGTPMVETMIELDRTFYADAPPALPDLPLVKVEPISEQLRTQLLYRWALEILSPYLASSTATTYSVWWLDPNSGFCLSGNEPKLPNGEQRPYPPFPCGEIGGLMGFVFANEHVLEALAIADQLWRTYQKGA